jgi:hypothetical protein
MRHSIGERASLIAHVSRTCHGSSGTPRIESILWTPAGRRAQEMGPIDWLDGVPVIWERGAVGSNPAQTPPSPTMTRCPPGLALRRRWRSASDQAAAPHLDAAPAPAAAARSPHAGAQPQHAARPDRRARRGASRALRSLRTQVTVTVSRLTPHWHPVDSAWDRSPPIKAPLVTDSDRRGAPFPSTSLQ